MKQKWILPLLIIALFVVGIGVVALTGGLGGNVSADSPTIVSDYSLGDALPSAGRPVRHLFHHHPDGSGLDDPGNNSGPYICMVVGSDGYKNHSFTGGPDEHEGDHGPWAGTPSGDGHSAGDHAACPGP